MLSILNPCRQPIKMMRNQIPPVRIAILISLQTIKEGESLEEREPTYTVGGYIYWHSHYKRQSPNARKKERKKKKKKTRELSLEFDIPTPGPISQENHNSVRHMHPNVHCRLLTTAKTQNQQNAPHPIQAQRRCGVCIQWTVTQPQKHMNLCHW